MKTFIILISIFLISCNYSSTESNLADKDPTQINNTDTLKSVQQDAPQNPDTELYAWLVDFDAKTIKRNPKLKKEYLNVDTLIKGLNELYPNIKLDKVKMSGDTLFTEIKDSEYLGERMGSTGAASYIADVIINLTSINKIKYVKIDLNEGSHASPGIWSLKDFSDYKVVH